MQSRTERDRAAQERREVWDYLFARAVIARRAAKDARETAEETCRRSESLGGAPPTKEEAAAVSELIR